MNEECLRLTTYFGERDRIDGRLLSDALLDLYGEHRARSSILLRGAEGFGRLHHLRTDRLLSLSEDLPVVSVAVDRRDRIETLLGPVLQATRKGMVTLEPVRLLSGEIDTGELTGAGHEAVKLTVYLGRRQRVGRRPAHVAVCELLQRQGVAGATVLLGVDGTRHGARQRAAFFGRNREVPMMIIAVGRSEVLARALTELAECVPEPLLTLERAQLCKRDGELLTRPRELPQTDADGRGVWQKLTVHTAQADTHEGRPLNVEIIRRLRESQSAGVTSLRGIWGFHGDHPPHGDRFLQQRRHVPVVTISVDTPQRTAEAFAIVDELTAEQGLVTCETVPAMRAMSAERTVGGLALADLDR